MDFLMLVGVLLLYTISIIVVYSASGGDMNLLWKQLGHVIFSLFALLIFSQIDLDTYNRWSYFCYFFSIFLLILVLVMDVPIKGSKRWLDLGIVGFQPSEVIKITLPMALSRFIAVREPPIEWKPFLVCLLLTGVPVFLILQQPDLGTAVMIGASGLIVLFIAGLTWKLILPFSLGGLLCIPIIWSFLHDYQKRRLLFFLDPESDPLNAGYNIIQSKIAIGSGGMYGKGWTNGTQSGLDFLPESTTDFIFAVYCEEFGFIGFLILVFLYILLIFRGMLISLESRYVYGKLLCISLCFSFFSYSYVNMGMASGQLPVVGVPLPMISMGGTSMLSMSILLGMMIAIRNKSRESIYA